MLRQFTVSNSHGFREKATLDLNASRYREHPSHLCPAVHPGSHILKSAAIFGANGSGKSQLISTIEFAVKLIKGKEISSSALQRLQLAEMEESSSGASRFEFVFDTRRKTYRYGFYLSVSEYPEELLEFQEEWLYEVRPRSERMVYLRWNAEGLSHAKPGRPCFQRAMDIRNLHFAAAASGPGNLMLRQARAGGIEQVRTAYDWFDREFLMLGEDHFQSPLPASLCGESAFHHFLTRHLRDAGTGISRVALRNTPAGSHDPAGGEFVTVRDRREGERLLFTFDQESYGLRKFVHLLALIYESRSPGLVGVMDDYDRGLHPHLAKYFLEIFLNGSEEQRRQLIFTSRNPLLMDQDLLRRDEIWFVSRETSTGNIRLRWLREMGVRNDLRLGKAYMEGRLW